MDRSILINETAARRIGGDNLVGETISVNPGRRTIVGIVSDFNFDSARQEMMPIVFFPSKDYSSRVYVRLPAGKIPEGVSSVRQVFADVYGQQLFGYWFLNDQFSKQYRSDEMFASNAGLFSILAILIAALGIFGMTTYTTEQKRREISVRKVLGASESGILWLLSWKMLRWVLLSNVIAWPIAWFAMSRWLQQFNSHIPLQPTPFLLAGLTAILIAFITIAIQSQRAVRINPAVVLRTE